MMLKRTQWDWPNKLCLCHHSKDNFRRFTWPVLQFSYFGTMFCVTWFFNVPKQGENRTLSCYCWHFSSTIFAFLFDLHSNHFSPFIDQLKKTKNQKLTIPHMKIFPNKRQWIFYRDLFRCSQRAHWNFLYCLWPSNTLPTVSPKSKRLFS